MSESKKDEVTSKIAHLRGEVNDLERALNEVDESVVRVKDLLAELEELL